MRPEPRGVVVLFYIYDFFRGDYGVDWHVIVAAVLQHYEPAVNLVQQQVEGEVAVGHGNDRIDGIGITTADQISQLLIDYFDRLAIVVLGR